MNGIEKNCLQGLEYQVDKLLRNIQQLRTENSTLRNKLLQLENRLDKFGVEKEFAAKKIKKVINELREKIK